MRFTRSASSVRISARLALNGILPALLLHSLVCVRAADAACTTLQDASAVLASAKQWASCNDRWLRFGPATSCTIAPPPACAGSLVSDAIALAYGANNPAASKVNRAPLRPQLACQTAIGKGVANFIGLKLRYLILGGSEAVATAKARRLLDQIPQHCGVSVGQDVSGVIVPDVGAQLDAAVGAPGTAVDGTSLRDAFITLLGTWVDRVAPSSGPPRPNIVIILADDQRFDTIGTAHSIDGVTPVMQNVTSQIAARGVTFSNSFTTTALCAPSRSSMLAGQYAHTTGVHDNAADGGFASFNDASTLAVWLRAAGYHTGLFGKYLNGYAAASPYQPPGWDEWHAFRAPGYLNYKLAENGVEVRYGSSAADYSTDVLRDKVVAYIHSVAGAAPFFVYFTPYAPHAPATPASRHAGMFSGVPPWRPPNFNEADVSDKPAWVQAIAPWDQARIGNEDAFGRMQLECLQAVDEAVAAILQALRDTGQDKNTIVIYAADNGYSWGSHRWEPKQCPYEECMRVPLVVSYPGLTPLPRTDSRFALNIDYAETVAELAGATPDPGVEGTSLVRVLDGTTPTWRADFLEEHWDSLNIPTFAEIRGTPWKYNEYSTNETELYDLDADPFEQANVTGDTANAGVKATLAARLRELRPGWPAP